jgi:hypothetical protein
MLRRVLAAVLVASALVAGGSSADAKPDLTKARADLESLVRWFHAEDAEEVLSPSPTALLARVAGYGDASVRAVLDEAADATASGPAWTFRADVAALLGALYGVEPPACEPSRECRLTSAAGAAVPVVTLLEESDSARDVRLPRIAGLATMKLRPRAAAVTPSEMFSAFDAGRLGDLNGTGAMAAGVALGEACRADANAAEVMRRARADARNAVLLHAFATLGKPDGAAFLAERLAAEAARAAAGPDATVATLFHALRRADAARCDAAVAALPPAAQDAVFLAIGRQLALPRLLALHRSAADDAARAAVVKRALAILSAPSPDGRRRVPRGAAAEAAVHLVAAGMASADASLRTAAEAANTAVLRFGGIEMEYHEIVPKFVREKPHTPRLKTGRWGFGPTARAEATIVACARGLAAGEFTLAPGPSRVFGAETPEPETLLLDHSLVTEAAPAVGFEPDARKSDGPLALKGAWTDGGLALTLTNRGKSPVTIAPWCFAECELNWLEIFVPPDAAAPSYRLLEMRLGPRNWGDAVPVAAAAKLVTLAGGASHSWTLRLPEAVRAADHISVELWTDDLRIAGTPAAPFVSRWSPAWIR